MLSVELYKAKDYTPTTLQKRHEYLLQSRPID